MCLLIIEKDTSFCTKLFWIDSIVLQYHLKIKSLPASSSEWTTWPHPRMVKDLPHSYKPLLALCCMEAIWAIQRSDQPTAAAMDKAFNVITAVSLLLACCTDSATKEWVCILSLGIATLNCMRVKHLFCSRVFCCLLVSQTRNSRKIYQRSRIEHAIN